MTPYIFRKYTGFNQNEIKCWSLSTGIQSNSFDNESISFSRGTSKAGTSIPSPLARFELFNTAFGIISNPKTSLKGNTIYHQLVSDCLDMMQIIFNSKNSEIGIGKKICFKEWKIADNIAKLKSKGENHPHYLLGKSYEQILKEQGEHKYSNIDSIYLIYYENKLMGGTSPMTLFFTTPNWSRYISDGLIANIPQSKDGDVFFDDDYRALYERDKEFITYLYKLLLNDKETNAFKNAINLKSYINKTIKKLDEEQGGWKNEGQNFLSQLSSNNNEDSFSNSFSNRLDSDYSKVIIGQQNQFLEIVRGLVFHHQKEEDVIFKISSTSDFVIRATQNYYENEESAENVSYKINPPLVLVHGMNVAGDYLEKNSPWNPNTRLMKAHYWGTDGLIPLYERVLPQGNNLAGITYPYITTDDFLEDNLIEMPFKLNNEKFFTGFDGDFKYLLPIRKQYFNFFSLEDLRKNIKIENTDDYIKVNLKVPIKNKRGVNEIVFTKTYKKGQKEGIIEVKNGIGIFPFYRIIDNDSSVRQFNEYTVLLADRNNSIDLSSLQFYKYSDIIKKVSVPSDSIERTIKGLSAGSKYFKVGGTFDLIEMEFSENGIQTSGLIIPIWNEKRVIATGKKFSFAIDFGTSNTHIAFTDSPDNKNPTSFEIGEADMQVILLNKPEQRANISEKYRSGYGSFADLDILVNREFIPLIFGNSENTQFFFPIRTATCEKADFKASAPNLFGNINIGFYIDHEESKPNEVNYTTNLKWLFENNAEDTSNTNRIEAFLTGILLLIRNKVIINGGELKDTQICWMRPQSMTQFINDQLVDAWNRSMKKVFKNLENIFEPNPISESLAPYYYFKYGPDGNFKNRAADSINIDIGGGTTDVIYLNKKNDKYITTSFRFAANDLWGSGFVSGRKDNGFINNYLRFNEKNKRPNDSVDNILKSFLSNNTYKSEDVISLLFKYDHIFKFTDSIKKYNPELIIIFYLHYSAIIFHVIKILESRGIDTLPKYFTFTGKGSQYIKLMCGDEKLTEFTTLILRSFTQLKIDNGFKVILSDKPKETTANGGVLFITSNEGDKIYLKPENEVVHFGATDEINSLFRVRFSKNSDAISNQTFQASVLGEVQDFIDKLLLLQNENGFIEERIQIENFLTGYNIKNLDTYYNELSKGNCKVSGSMINDSFDSYVDKLSSIPNEKICETFFFYGLKDAIYELSKFIVENKH